MKTLVLTKKNKKSTQFISFNSKIIGPTELVITRQGNIGGLTERIDGSQPGRSCEISTGHFGCAFQHSCSE